MDPQVICIIMGGGRGTRLYPLTQERCKPAVPIAGRYRLVDIPISNCLNSGYNKIFILTQFNTASLHRHIQMSYKFDAFSGGFVDILSAEQTDGSDRWYQGTADAVRQNLHHFGSERDDDIFVILSGDQLYRMDLEDIIEHHKRARADVTVAATPVPHTEVSGLGVMRVLDDYSIGEFVEKPKDPEVIKSLLVSDRLRKGLTRLKANNDYCLASMGIYVFNGRVIRESLAENPDATDFGKEIIPSMLRKKALYSYIFDSYWEDIGTVRAFFDANLMLTDEDPDFDFFDVENPIYTRARHLPPSSYVDSKLDRAVCANGSRIVGSHLKRCLIGVRSMINKGSRLENVFMMGADYFDEQSRRTRLGTDIPLGVGENCDIRNAIIDKNARIGKNVVLSPEGKPDKYEQDGVYIRDGVLVVLKGAIIPDGTVIAPDKPKPAEKA